MRPRRPLVTPADRGGSRSLALIALFTALSTALVAAPVHAGSTITVNATTDGIVIDSVLTLREAMILGGWYENDPDGGNPGKICFTAAEKAQVSGDGAGCFLIASPLLLGCEYNPLSETRYVPNNNCSGFESGPGFGRNHVDTIGFAASVATVVTSGLLDLARFDTLDGAAPGGGRVRLLWSGVDADFSGLRMRFESFGVDPDQTKVRNLELEGFSGNCVSGDSVRDAEFTNLLLHHCGFNGIRLGPGTRTPSGNKIGGGAGLGNEIRDNGQFGVRLEGSAALSPAPQTNFIQGNRIGWALGDSANAHGNALGGVAIVNSANTRIGSSGAEVNRIAGNGGPGILLSGPETRQAEVLGNFIGLVDPFGTWVAKPNGAGIALEAGANNNTIGGSTVSRRNVVAGNAGHGVRLAGESDFNSVQGNWIGLDPTGAAKANLGDGVLVEGPASQNQILGNLVSANTGVGIRILGVGADSNTVDLNVVGLDPGQSLARGNGDHGIQFAGGAKNNRAGSGAGLGNHIAGNAHDGININGVGTDGNAAYANLVGLDFNRFNAVPNGWGGVTLLGGAKNNVLGAVGAGNTLSGNGVVGVYVAGSGTNQNVIRGNRVGLAAGDGAIGNGQGGIVILADADLNTIDANVVSGNGGPGIEILGPGLAGGPVTANLVGRDAADLVDRPNQGDGIRLVDGVLGAELSGNTVRANLGDGIYLRGATTSGTLVRGNTVTGQAGDGIFLDGAGGNAIGTISPLQPNDVRQNGGVAVRVVNASGNSIRGNVLREHFRSVVLDFGLSGNDPFDGDAGANQLQNYPIPMSVASGNGAWALLWGLMSAANTTYNVDYYVGACGQDGRGEAHRLLRSVQVGTDARGLFRGVDFFLEALPAEPYLTLSATDLAGNTSEMSPCIPLGEAQRIFRDGFESGALDGWWAWRSGLP